MASDAYRKLLLDPRWQRKRLEIFERDAFECTNCGATDRTLHVHHKRYVWGLKPWESESEDLVTLCEPCHENATDATKALKDAVAKLDPVRIPFLVGVAVGVQIKDAWIRVDGRGVLAPWARESIQVFSYEMADGIASIVGLTADRIIALVNSDGHLPLEAVAMLMERR